MPWRLNQQPYSLGDNKGLTKRVSIGRSKLKFMDVFRMNWLTLMP